MSATLAEAVRLAVADGVSETGRPDVTGRGHETDRLRARVVAGRAVARIAHSRDRQRQPIGVRVVGKQAEAGIDSVLFVIATNPLSLLATGGCGAAEIR